MSSTLWRKVAAATWNDPNDPKVFGKISFDVTELEEALDTLKSKSDPSKSNRLTISCLIAWAVAQAIEKNKEANAYVRGGQIVPMKDVNVNMAMSFPGNDQIWLAKIKSTPQQQFESFVEQYTSQIETIKKEKSQQLMKNEWLVSSLPTFMLVMLMKFFTSLESDYGINLSIFGIPNAPFQASSVCVSSAVNFGFDEAYATFPGIIQPCPFIVVLNTITEKPWIVIKDGKKTIEPRRVLTLTLTADHRVFDGKLAGRVVASIKNNLHQFASDILGREITLELNHPIKSKL